MLGFYILTAMVFTIPLSLLIGIPYDLAQFLIYVALTWVFATSKGIYKSGAWAAIALALGYFMHALLPFVAHILDPFVLLGMLGLLYLLVRLPHRSALTWKEWLAISAIWLATVGFYFGLSELSGHWPTVSFVFAVLKLFLFSAALGLIRAAVEGKAPEGRFLWVMGLGLLWLTEFLIAAREAEVWNPAFFDLGNLSLRILLLLCTGLVVLGAFSEDRELKIGLLPYIASAAAIEIAWICGAVGLQGTNMAVFLGWQILAAGLLFASMLMLLNGYVVQREQAEQRSREWEEFLTELTQLPRDPVAKPELYLAEVLEKLRLILPSIRGISIYSNPPLELGEKTSQSLDLDDGQRPIGALFVDDMLDESENFSWTGLLAEKIGRFIGEVRWQAEALLDPLTGLARRRPTIYRSIYEQAQLEQIPLTLIILDIDHFKIINDTYGHSEGDRVLARVGEILRRSVRSRDLPVRWGGEEFLVILWNTRIPEAIEVAERIRNAIQNDTELNITISAGVAGGEIPTDLGQIQNWVTQADQALYQAKKEGRNRVRIYITSPAP